MLIVMPNKDKKQVDDYRNVILSEGTEREK